MAGLAKRGWGTDLNQSAGRLARRDLAPEDQPLAAAPLSAWIGSFTPWGASAPPSPSLAAPAVIDLGALDGSDGFRITGTDAYDRSGFSVSSAGDVNGDGFDDIIIGAYGADGGGDSDAGESYVVFGQAAASPARLKLADLDGSNGFRLDGVDVDDKSGRSVSAAGDVNGDGFDDVIIGAYAADQGLYFSVGESYVVFGKASGFAKSVDLATLDGTNGFRLDGINAGDYTGRSVSSAGDINGDGLDDIIIGASGGDPGGSGGAGESYVVFGKTGAFTASLDLASLDGANGFRIDGIDASDVSGFSVSSAGDVNGDGFDDVIVGAFGGDPGGGDDGESYVVLGKAGGFTASLDLASLDGGNGFRLDGIDAGDNSGASVSSAGDVNGDGLDDIIIGASSADPGGDTAAGESYVVFGKAGGFAASLDLAALDGSNGFRIDGIDPFDFSGKSVSSAGDFNGDGFDDIIVGAYGADPGGETYVVFGKAAGFAASLDPASLDGSNGFRLDGAGANDLSGCSVSSAGDVNGDGFDDIIVGARGATPGGDFYAGESYVIFGFGDAAPTIPGGAGNDNLVGGAAAEVLLGKGGNDTLQGNGGGDTLNGGAGTDWADYLSAAAKVRADLKSPGSNTGDADGDVYLSIENLRGSSGRDKLYGDNLANRIEGRGKEDLLVGRGGKDTLAGGAGKDTLTGGGQNDRFELASARATDADTITDFAAGDKIALDGDVFGLPAGALAGGRFVVGGAAQDGNDRLIYKAGQGKLYFDPDGTGAQGQVLIATFVGMPTLAASDFIVI